MKDHDGDIKQYYIESEAYYGEVTLKKSEYVDNVMFGFYSPDGGTSGEMGMEWILLSNHAFPVPRLVCYDDAWHALAQFKDVIDALAEVDGENITVQQFCRILERCGFVDKTLREPR